MSQHSASAAASTTDCNKNGVGGDNIVKEIPWTDDRIRWDDVSNDNNNDDPSHDETPWRDPFQSEDSTEIFTRTYTLAGPEQPEETNNHIIEVQLRGYQAEADEIWKSTGLTLWRASDYLCEYLMAHPQMLLRRDKNNRTNSNNILELGAGLGLVGIVAHRILLASSDWSGQHHTSSRVILTDGDTETLKQLRVNLEYNHRLVETLESCGSSTHDDNDINCQSSPILECRQLLWGRETALQFQRELQQRQEQLQSDSNTNSSGCTTFDLILASDIIYAASIVDPLWETIQVLLSKPAPALPVENDKAATAAVAGESVTPPPQPCFVLAFAQRRVPVTIDTVLEAAVQHGFTYQLVQEDPTGIFIYIFRWSEQPVAQQLQQQQRDSRTRNDRPADGELELYF